MREMLHPMAWRLPHWLIALGGAAWLSIVAGLLQPRELVMWFANRPEVAQAFGDPHFGRADALILVFSTLFLGPFALFIACVVSIFMMAVLGGFALPLVRWLSLPDWLATALVGGGIIALAWTQSDLWLPRSLWFLGLLARAWGIVLA